MNKVVDIEKRDYSLVGSSAQRALELGLASAEWYRSDVPRATMKELMRRSDAPAIRDTIIWIGRYCCRPRASSTSGAVGGPCRSFSCMACSTAPRATRAGTNAGTAPPFGPVG